MTIVRGPTVKACPTQGQAARHGTQLLPNAFGFKANGIILMTDSSATRRRLDPGCGNSTLKPELKLQVYLGAYIIRVHLLRPKRLYVNSPLCSMRYGNAALPAGVAPSLAVKNGRSLTE